MCRTPRLSLIKINVSICVTAHPPLPEPNNSLLIKSKGICLVKGGVGAQSLKYWHWSNNFVIFDGKGIIRKGVIFRVSKYNLTVFGAADEGQSSSHEQEKIREQISIVRLQLLRTQLVASRLRVAISFHGEKWNKGLAYLCLNSWKSILFGKPCRQILIPSRTPLHLSWSSTSCAWILPA